MNRVLLFINLSVILFSLFLVGCNDKDVYKDEDSNLTADDVFNFSTRQDVNISLNYTVPDGYRVSFEVYQENPLTKDEYGNYLRNDAKPIATGYTKDNGECDVTLSVADYVETLYVYSSNIGVPRILEGNIENGKVKITNESTAAVQKQSRMSRAVTDPYYKNWKMQELEWVKSLINYDDNGKLTSSTKKLNITAENLANINATIPEGEQLDARFCHLSEITLSEAADVTMYYVSNMTADRENALAYYTYTDVDMENVGDKQAWINKHLILLFPRLSADVVACGDGVQLKYWDGNDLHTTFPAGSKIGFVLLVDAWKENGVAMTTNVMYSDNLYNRYDLTMVGGTVIMGQRPQMAAFKTGDEHFILSFEDQPWTDSPKYPQYKGDFRNNIFVLHANPETALPPVEPGEDVEDKPIPGVEMFTNGTLAFEDVWPYKGDYDLNDVVVEYDVTDYFSLESYRFNGFEGDFTFVNNGAQFTNGFGIQLPSSRANIKSCTITSDYTYAKQGLDEELDQATIMLFDNGKNVLKGTKFHVRVEYVNGTGPTSLPNEVYKKIMTAPYNPFITIDDEGGQRKEVHLVNYLPTPKADEKLLHYGHDLSNPDGGVYYVSDAKFPFAINITSALDFKTPDEAVRIDKKYPRFSSWVESDGKKDKDWYK